MSVELLRHMEAVLPHLIQSNLAIIGACHQQLQGVHHIHTAYVWLSLSYFVESKVFVLLIGRVLPYLFLFFFQGLLIFLV